MSDILRQVDEDLRKDKLLRIWKLYRIYIIGFILFVLIALSSYQYYLFSEKSKNEIIVEKYINAINSTDKNVAISQLIEISNKTNGGSVIALEKVAKKEVQKYGIIDPMRKIKNFY